jgi:hypothetical protein
MMNLNHLQRCVVFGFIAVLCALFLAEFLSSPAYYKLDSSGWPLAAQQILMENGGGGVTKDQWARLDELDKTHHFMKDFDDLGRRSVQDAWYWFIVMPLLFGYLALKNIGNVTLLRVLAIFLPSIFVLLFSFI